MASWRVAWLTQIRRLAARLGLVDPAFVERLSQLLQRASLPIQAPAIGVDRFVDLMRLDKKAEGRDIRFVVVDADGRATVRAAPDALVRAVIARHSAPPP